jgi:long-subunit fatty acid transport protein
MILKNATLFMFGFLLIASPAWASKTISSPYVEKGAVEIEAKSGYILDDEEAEDAWEIETTAAYGVTDWWEAEIGVAFEDEGRDEDVETAAVILESTFQFTEPGEFWVDPGLKIEYAHSTNSGANEIEAKLLLAKQMGAFNHLANISVGREVGDESEDETVYGFDYGLSYNISEEFAIGAEWYSDFGNFEDGFDEQGHQLGPVIYGAAPFGLEYEAGVLIGVSESAPDAEAKLVIGYEF